jgi:hypothetical protein
MSNKILEECLIEFCRFLKEWGDEIGAHCEQQLVSLLSSPNILDDNNSIDPHDSIATSKNSSTIQTFIKPPESVLGGDGVQNSPFVQPTHLLTPHLFQKIAKKLYEIKT